MTPSARNVIDELAGIAPASALAALRAERQKVRDGVERAEGALLEPDDAGGLTLRDRESAAVRVAVLLRDAGLLARHGERLRRLGVDEAAVRAIERFPEADGVSVRAAAILRHVDRLTCEPGAVNAEHLQRLRDAGLSVRDVVTLAQLTAFLAFEARLAAGLRALVASA